MTTAFDTMNYKMFSESYKKEPLVRHAIWFGVDSVVTAHERIGGKELSVVSVNYSFPRETAPHEWMQPLPPPMVKDYPWSKWRELEVA